MSRIVLTVAAAFILVACGGDDAVTPDTSVTADTGMPDTGTPDSAPPDTGVLDTGTPDASADSAMDGAMDGAMDSAPADATLDAGFVCAVNLLDNPMFDADVSSWVPAFPSVNTVDHDPTLDAAGSATSGSLRSRSTRALTQRDPIGQCVPVSAGARVTVQAAAMIAASGTEDGEVQLTLNFYGMADCGGAFLTTQTSPRESSEGGWLTLEVSGTAPATTMSMRIMLDVLRTAGTELTTHWDDVCAVAL